MQTWKQRALALMGAIAFGTVSAAAADIPVQPAPRYHGAAPHYGPPPVAEIRPHAPPPVVVYRPVPPPVVYYHYVPPPVVVGPAVYPRRYFAYPHYPRVRYVGPRHYGPYVAGYPRRYWHR
jgi:hypothetical protein